ncbi:putative transcription factor MYB-HB-like family [Rosa chinensis]|uniref:Putative transcription factor MYB-HB-like family n=1 Tax=Rosa chinensis TaxID=74649 RepID=A0A2P6SIC5_ROSCH|nr:MYB-like transcription factor ETC3 [Rosa chinensis]PRQ58418.1 putative transcription factor MYB-HB-like family [Rosa chinensis]
MDVKRRRKQAKTSSSSFSEEVSSIEWEFINMSEQEEDLICRMYKLVGDRWGLIAGRLPGRKAEEIERFWLMRHGEVFASRRRTEQEKYQQPQQLSNSNNMNKSTKNSRRYNS